MFKIDTAGNVGGLFSDGAPPSVPPTIVSDEWLNAVQTELVNVVLGAGLALNKADSGQVLLALQQLFGAGYKRDLAPTTNYTTLAAFLAGTYVSIGTARSLAGEIAEYLDVASAGANGMLYSMVVSTTGCTPNVIVAQAGNTDVYLYVDGVLAHTWALGVSTTPYAMVLGAGTHVIQFLLNNSGGSAAMTYINDWMTGNAVTWLRAAHS